MAENKIQVDAQQTIHHRTGRVIRLQTKTGKGRSVPLFRALKYMLIEWHTYAHRCSDKFTVHQVSMWLGHSSLAITSIYLWGTPSDPSIDPFAPPPRPANVVPMPVAMA